MSKVDFTITANGYSPGEVDKYIEMIQQEYNNAVAWGQEMEKKLQEMKDQLQQSGVYFTIDEANQTEVIERVFNELKAKVTEISKETDAKAKAIIDKANERSHEIVKLAMEKSVEMRSQNDLIKKNLKSISEMINVITENP